MIQSPYIVIYRKQAGEHINIWCGEQSLLTGNPKLLLVWESRGKLIMNYANVEGKWTSKILA